MTDVVVTVPKGRWAEWIGEGDLPGQAWSGSEYAFSGSGALPKIEPGERVYVVAHGKVRGYAPLVDIETGGRFWSLIRAGGAVALTTPETVRGFQGWRYRWWERETELAFPDWQATQEGEIHVAIDQREMTEATDQTEELEATEPQADADKPMLDDPLSPEDRAARVPLTAAELRQRALGNLLPTWTRERHRLALANGDLEDAKGQVKSAKAALERQEASLEHVGSCRLEHCLRCEEIATNPAPKPQAEEADDGEAEESELEPRADADYVADAEALAVAQEAGDVAVDQVDGAVSLEEIAARGGADRETAKVSG